ncbi:MAG: hypothetical protein M1835_002746 [Candelina submexicana]|nr:MAG: hypothetical protein M1835_002746 [Candelina submexicana]
MARIFNLNSRTLTAPIAALTMACLLFVYSRTSIQAAKRNAQRHREADGGQINWRNESLRQHGVLGRPEDQEPVKQLVLGAKSRVDQVVGKGVSRNKEEEALRARMGKRKGD